MTASGRRTSLWGMRPHAALDSIVRAMGTSPGQRAREITTGIARGGKLLLQ
jgi:hypothetical protein